MDDASDDERARVLDLWDQGVSSGVISGLTRFSRGAVMGMVRRSGPERRHGNPTVRATSLKGGGYDFAPSPWPFETDETVPSFADDAAHLSAIGQTVLGAFPVLPLRVR
jgi:hypothetical protein